MQVACVIAQCNVREPGDLAIKDFKIPFKHVTPEGDVELTPEEEKEEKERISRQSIAAWFSMLGPQNIRIAGQDAERSGTQQPDR